MQRIEAFLLEVEVPDWASSLKRSAMAAATSRIGFENATFSWHAAPQTGTVTPWQLKNLNVDLPRGITLITGNTGAGKSAFLSALLGGKSSSKYRTFTKCFIYNVRNALFLWDGSSGQSEP